MYTYLYIQNNVYLYVYPRNIKTLFSLSYVNIIIIVIYNHIKYVLNNVNNLNNISLFLLGDIYQGDIIIK